MSDENVGGLVELLPCPFCGEPPKASAPWMFCGDVKQIASCNGTDSKPHELISMESHRWNARALSAHGHPEPNGKLVGWWNGISRHDDRDGTGPSVRWGEGAENTYHDIPLYDGYNPIHYVTPPAHGQPVVDAHLVERILNTRVPGGSLVWWSINGGGIGIDDGHRNVVRRVLEAYLSMKGAPHEH